MPRLLAERMTQLMVNSNSCTASFTQRAGVAALTGTQEPSRLMVEEFRRRRELIVQGLSAIPGFICHRPGGAFYAFPDVRGTGMPSRALAELLLNEAGVAVLDGASFGAAGDGFLRLSYANSLENISRALDRIAATVRASSATARHSRN
jgi:aspartate/methionine/tyrosine aminotransferase